MKHLTVIMILFCASGMISDEDNLNPGFEFSGVDNFWPVVDVLLMDKSPDNPAWESLYTTPGYKEIIRREFKASMFTEYIKACYKPSLAKAREEILENAKVHDRSYWRWFIPSYFAALDYALEHREAVDSLRASFKTYPYSQLATDLLLQYLPETEVGGLPDVSFIIFNDSRGYTPIIMSLNELYKEEAELTDVQLEKLAAQGKDGRWLHVVYFAHEFFHHYRDMKLELKEPEEGNSDRRILWYLNQVENEGIADLINIYPLCEPGCPLEDSAKAEKIRKEQSLQPQAIKDLDAMFVRMHTDPDSKAELVKKMGNIITRSGHPMGYYMAKAILKARGQQALVDVVRNPFQFFQLYNKVANADEELPGFSKDAMKFISQLEKAYIVE